MLGGFLILATINYAVIQYFQNQQKNDTAVVNAAGRNRMLSQQVAFFSEQVAKGDTTQRKKLQQTIDLHNISLNALKTGGVAPGIAHDEPLPHTPTSILSTLLHAESLWEKYKMHAETIVNENTTIDSVLYRASLGIDGQVVHIPYKIHLPNPTLRQSLTYIESNASELLQRNDALVKRYVAANKEKQKMLDLGLILLLLVNISLIIGAIRFLHTHFVAPLRLIENGTAQLAAGSIDQSISYQADNEIGRAIQNIKILSENLKRAASFAQKVGKGEFNTQYSSVSELDILGTSLIAMRDQLAEAAHKDYIRTWITTGLAKFAELTRTYQQNTTEMAQEALSALIVYLDANQGAFYIVDEEGDESYLTLIALHAWGRKKYRQLQFEKGEGIAGQVWQEEQYIYLKEIPEDYIAITSGLGKAKPKTLLVVPLKINNETLGVLEIASFREYKEYEIKFTIQATEVIASALSVIRTSDLTQAYLVKAREQAEELRSQEEEMRQNMEELSATQEEMFRKEKEYIRQIGELKQQLKEAKIED